jgi:hypothetical protein
MQAVHDRGAFPTGPHAGTVCHTESMSLKQIKGLRTSKKILKKFPCGI